MPRTTLRQRQDALATLARIGDEATRIRTRLADRISALRTDERYAEDYRAKLIEQARAEAATEAKQLHRRADAAREAVLTAAHELEQPTGNTAAQLLTATHEKRAWDRVRPMLEAGRSWQSVLANVERNGDGATVQAIAAELPAYVESTRTITHAMNGNAGEPLDLGHVTHALQLSLERTLGNDNGPGSAATLRLRVEADGPVADAHLDRLVSETAGRQTGIGDAVAVQLAEQQRDAIRAELSTPAQQYQPA
ncbi:hypothetical protein HUO13_02475 [Saccharopolyspora erythraea]|uniref:hypothetical protein n=1 Tax=Saccharopolyspora erythraea TaxID=1836 RepID=UPI001BACFB4E|nr:hypothetical protein [Saccharopolyspora erythraea]QUG99816.1 hypothetical protein HUO13_02475 [Saccharopolyspora erythraea]